MEPDFEFCRRPGAAVVTYGGSSGGMTRIGTKDIFPVNYEPVKHLRARPPQGEV